MVAPNIGYTEFFRLSPPKDVNYGNRPPFPFPGHAATVSVTTLVGVNHSAVPVAVAVGVIVAVAVRVGNIVAPSIVGARGISVMVKFWASVGRTLSLVGESGGWTEGTSGGGWHDRAAAATSRSDNSAARYGRFMTCMPIGQERGIALLGSLYRIRIYGKSRTPIPR